MKLFACFAASALAAPTPVIIGGSNARNGQFPWQVTLTKNNSHYCGGSIIGSNKVMCAAHCYQSNGTLKAGAGSATRASQPQVKTQSKQERHPSYNSRTIDYDYMVITISGSWSMNSNVASIPLPSPSNSEVVGSCSTSGYGYTRGGGSNPNTIASTLQWSKMNCINNATCKRSWPTSTLTGRQQCAEYPGATSCMGDSGGPLTYKEGGRDVLLGNVSWGHSKCDQNRYPSVYSRNKEPNVNSWIKGKM